MALTGPILVRPQGQVGPGDAWLPQGTKDRIILSTYQLGSNCPLWPFSALGCPQWLSNLLPVHLWALAAGWNLLWVARCLSWGLCSPRQDTSQVAWEPGRLQAQPLKPAPLSSLLLSLPSVGSCAAPAPGDEVSPEQSVFLALLVSVLNGV